MVPTNRLATFHEATGAQERLFVPEVHIGDATKCGLLPCEGQTEPI